ncbi:unnamed protein product, partial [Scytosiphon promiscuus]
MLFSMELRLVTISLVKPESAFSYGLGHTTLFAPKVDVVGKLSVVDAPLCPHCAYDPQDSGRTCATPTQNGDGEATTGGAKRKKGAMEGKAVEPPVGTSTIAGQSERRQEEGMAVDDVGRNCCGRGSGAWAVGGALFSSLSASADALLMDGSKAVRTKALACSLRILEVHGSAARRAPVLSRETNTRSTHIKSPRVTTCTHRRVQVAKGAWAALVALAADNGGSISQASHAHVGSGGARHRKAADTARDLLTLPCIEASPVDLCLCYERCRAAFGVDEGGAMRAAEAKRVLRDVAQASFCGDIGTLLRAVSDVMHTDEGRAGGKDDGCDDPKEEFRDMSTEFSTSPLSEVLREVLTGIDGEVNASLLHDALEAYAAGDDASRDHPYGETHAHNPRQRWLCRPTKPTNVNKKLLPARAGQPHFISQARPLAPGDDEHGGDDGRVLLRVLAASQRIFWGRLERRMDDIERDHQEEGQEGSGAEKGRERDRRSANGIGVTGDSRATAASEGISELSELLRLFQLLAAHSLISPEKSVDLEALVFPAALSRRRRLIRPAVGLALALEEPHRVLLSSLAFLQDAAFSRSSTDVGSRACDYVRLVGVLARENASFIAAHVREQYGMGSDDRRRAKGTEENKQDDYMAEVSNRAAMECEIRRLREASVTSDGMLSCYTPFLLAIVRRRVTNAARGGDARSGTTSGSDFGADASAGGVRLLDLSCPRALCAEALWALSEYAVLSPELAGAEVLPLAEVLATDTLEHAQIRKAAVGVLTRRELASDEIAARACSLLEDEDPRLRQEVLRRLGLLMKESRIKTAHLSKFALLLVDDVSQGVRRTAQEVFFDHLQPRPDMVCRCLFETFFTLDADEAVKERVLESLVAIVRRAVPGQGLESLGAALVRKAAETGDSGAAFFLSLVPPTVNSLEAAEVALRRGQLAHAPRDTISRMAEHFSAWGTRRG